MASVQYSTTDNKWQTSRTLVQCNDYMFTHQVACDVNFRVHGNGGQIVNVGAHKYVLMSRSSVFHAMLCGGLSSSEIDIVDIPIETFRTFIRYLYTDEVQMQVDQAFALMYASHKYMIQTLIVKCSEFLGRSIDAENICTMLDQSILFDEKELQIKSLAFIAENIEEVIEKENFLDLSYGSLLCIVKSDNLRIPELGLIHAVMRWADAQCKRQRLEPSKDNRRNVLKDVIYQLRFASLTPETFVRSNEMCNILNAEEIAEMFICKFSTEDKKKTTPWITLSRGSNVKSLSIIKPQRTITWVNQTTFNITIQCTKDIMIHAVGINTTTNPNTTATVTINGQNTTCYTLTCPQMIRFSNPILIKEKTIQIQIQYIFLGSSFAVVHNNIQQTNNIGVSQMINEIQDRGVTFTSKNKESPLMVIEYARYYE